MLQASSFDNNKTASEVQQEQQSFWDNVAPRMFGVIIAQQIAPNSVSCYSGEAIITMWSALPVLKVKKPQ